MLAFLIRVYSCPCVVKNKKTTAIRQWVVDKFW
jgi:hypothetical protein